MPAGGQIGETLPLVNGTESPTLPPTKHNTKVTASLEKYCGLRNCCRLACMRCIPLGLEARRRFLQLHTRREILPQITGCRFTYTQFGGGTLLGLIRPT